MAVVSAPAALDAPESLVALAGAASGCVAAAVWLFACPLEDDPSPLALERFVVALCQGCALVGAAELPSLCPVDGAASVEPR